jgi:hypothetical protein
VTHLVACQRDESADVDAVQEERLPTRHAQPKVASLLNQGLLR